MRFCFRYSLRTLFVVVTLLAIPCWYVGWQAKIVRDRKAMLAEMRDTGGAYWVWFNNDETAKLPWCRQMLGDEAIITIAIPKSMNDRSEEIWRMFPEAKSGTHEWFLGTQD